jgi:hypothetical protein
MLQTWDHSILRLLIRGVSESRDGTSNDNVMHPNKGQHQRLEMSSCLQSILGARCGLSMAWNSRALSQLGITPATSMYKLFFCQSVNMEAYCWWRWYYLLPAGATSSQAAFIKVMNLKTSGRQIDVEGLCLNSRHDVFQQFKMHTLHDYRGGGGVRHQFAWSDQCVCVSKSRFGFRRGDVNTGEERSIFWPLMQYLPQISYLPAERLSVKSMKVATSKQHRISDLGVLSSISYSFAKV